MWDALEYGETYGRTFNKPKCVFKPATVGIYICDWDAIRHTLGCVSIQTLGCQQEWATAVPPCWLNSYEKPPFLIRKSSSLRGTLLPVRRLLVTTRRYLSSNNRHHDMFKPWDFSMLQYWPSLGWCWCGSVQTSTYPNQKYTNIINHLHRLLWTFCTWYNIYPNGAMRGHPR